MDDQDAMQLLSALNGPLGGKLLSLDISDNELSDAMVGKIVQTLSKPKRIPTLQNLRMLSLGMQYQGYASLHRALSANKTLHYLHVSNPSQYTQQLHTRHMQHVRRQMPSASSDEDADSDGSFDDEEVEVTDRAGAKRIKIERNFNGELLASTLPMLSKLAFLSVVQHEMSAEKSCSALDALMVSVIFKLAAEHMHRHISWDD